MLKTHRRIALGVIAVMMLAGCIPGWYDDYRAAHISQLIEIKDGQHQIGEAYLISPTLVTRFYDATEEPVWVQSESMSEAGNALLQLLPAAENEGLDFLDYHYNLISALSKNIMQISNEEKADLEVLMTDAYLSYAEDLYLGVTCPEEVFPQFNLDCRKTPIDFVENLRDAITFNQIGASLDLLKPKYQQYFQLKSALDQYRCLLNDCIDYGLIKPTNDEIDLSLVTSKLIINGDLKQTNSYTNGQIEAALISFKMRHGLSADNSIDSATLANLNVPLEYRIEIIKANLERLRWLTDELGDRYVEVNIPSFSLNYVANEETLLSSRVIVGKQLRETPVFSTWIKGVRVNPYWTVPPTVLKEDILTLGEGIPAYLKKNQIKVLQANIEVDPDSISWVNQHVFNFPYVLRQEPGAHNALGQIRFLMPNPYAVYIHDTPAKRLFSVQNRLFSSGCIRLEKPFQLAELLLENDGQDPEQIPVLMSKSEQSEVYFRNPVRAHIHYKTAWVNEEGLVNFGNDIYGRDSLLINALNDY